MTQLTQEKYELKKAALVERTATALNTTTHHAAELLMVPRKQSIRINTLKTTRDTGLKSIEASGAQYNQAEWMDDGVFIETGIETLRDSSAISDGELYIQNAASWLPVLALQPQPGQKILDMCAAPGGKTSHIAQLTHNEALISANDNSRPRLHKLQHNLARLGVEGVEFLLHDATRLTQKLGTEQFDAILLDAPCSGEGMMRLNTKKDFESWSVAHIKRLQKLQKRLIIQAWQLLKPGGTLVYSTCTMAPEENEAVVDYLLRHNDTVKIEELTNFKDSLHNVSPAVQQWNGKSYDAELSKTLRLHPSPRVEAFFVAKLTKTDSSSF